VYHAISTCRMGFDSPPVAGLAMVSANTNAATLVIAEKAADMILAARGTAATPAVLRSIEPV